MAGGTICWAAAGPMCLAMQAVCTTVQSGVQNHPGQPRRASVPRRAPGRAELPGAESASYYSTTRQQMLSYLHIAFHYSVNVKFKARSKIFVAINLSRNPYH